MPRKTTAVKLKEPAPAAISDTEARALVGEPLLTAEQVAQLLQVSVSNLNKRRLDGDPPQFVKIGQNVRYRPADVRAYIADCIAVSTSSKSEPPPAA
jgi:predicted DNA-binding transcriptional regulator AlpA